MTLLSRLLHPKLLSRSAPASAIPRRIPAYKYPICRTMATTNNTSATPATGTDASNAETTQQQQPLPLPSPAIGSESIKLNVNSGEGVKLDHLGPMVVNRDGTLSRVGNWDQMSEIERQNTVRILGKRNQMRLKTLRAQEAEQEDGERAAKK